MSGNLPRNNWRNLSEKVTAIPAKTGESGMTFASRETAGQLLAEQLVRLPVKVNLILGIPRGGVLVAAEMARRLRVACAPLIIKKLGFPDNPEFAIGAVSKNTVYLDEFLIRKLRIDDNYLRKEIGIKQTECRKRERQLARYRISNLKNKVVVVTDDGVATGSTFLAAVKVVEQEQPAAIILAIPVVPPDLVHSIRKLAEHCIILAEPIPFKAVGQFYVDFHEVSDQEVKQVLQTVQKRNA